ncbi:MAG TPA: UvrB/UvrC motif-containing protein [Acetomicrobium sp.]|uniref:UvrB/UvrC motif-containing protein n=1 Tax=Acetomicrobium mobile TaxID=97477 RepID=UPI0026E93047|nr:UvrB/UvrC motif-containing protein [Acetomicrobium mobile]HOB10832.1 UvrB/UvrC motif-containing protein [Acetomicrobium sp.]HQA36270.1 UvrB/UvrC motif-containing protein [Acetomicrobium sp.]HQC88025.1 UvrB/UvrC motif-containing protein [Acetomicrobium sp.]
MLCERCQDREAEVHIKQMINGEVREYHLCRECAEAMSLEIDVFPHLSFDLSWENLLGSLFEPLASKSARRTTQTEVRCQDCGLDFTTFQKSGKFGCPTCYKTFREYIKPLLRKIHGSDRHRGDRPDVSAFRGEAVKSELERLQGELKEAVEREEYERAAKIRDRIRELTSKGDGSDGKA